MTLDALVLVDADTLSLVDADTLLLAGDTTITQVGGTTTSPETRAYWDREGRRLAIIRDDDELVSLL